MTPVALPTRRIVADIGGTHARFGLVQADGQIAHIHNLRTADYRHLSQALLDYVRRLPSGAGCVGAQVVVSIAAPLAGDRVRMTNAAWDFSIQETKRQLDLRALHLLNDFEALALAVPSLSADDLLSIGHRLALDTEKPKAILGPGTGLGMAGVMPAPQGRVQAWMARSSEGGHANVAPSNAREAALLQAAWELAQRPICWEDFLSGTGLPRLHQVVCQVDGFAHQAMTPPQITQAAFEKHDAACLATLQTFCALLGSAAGDLALVMGARGGVYLKGGVLDRVLAVAPDFLQRSDFRQCFENKGAYRSYLAGIPTWLITTPQVALRGCASVLEMES